MYTPLATTLGRIFRCPRYIFSALQLFSVLVFAFLQAVFTAAFTSCPPPLYVIFQWTATCLAPSILVQVVVGELLRRWMPVFEGVRCDVQVTLRANSVTVQSGSDQGSSQVSTHLQLRRCERYMV